MPGLSVNAWPTCIAWLNECNNCWWDGICISDLPKYMVIRWVPVSRSLEDNKYILSIITSQNTLLKIHKNSFWKRKCAVCHPKWMNEWTEHLSCHLKKNGKATIPFSEDDRTSLQRFAQHLGVYLQKTLKFYDVFITQFRLFWHHCDVAGCSVEKINSVLYRSLNALSYDILLDMGSWNIFSRWTLSLGANNEG